MLENSVVSASLLYDEDGVSGISTYSLLGSSTNNVFQTSPFNPFGSSPYGWQKIGSNPNESNLSMYRFWLEVNPNIPFYNISLQLAGDTENNDWNLVRMGYCIIEVIDQTALKYITGITT